jgi:hypothetical protein
MLYLVYTAAEDLQVSIYYIPQIVYRLCYSFFRLLWLSMVDCELEVSLPVQTKDLGVRIQYKPYHSR